MPNSPKPPIGMICSFPSAIGANEAQGYHAARRISRCTLAHSPADANALNYRKEMPLECARTCTLKLLAISCQSVFVAHNAQEAVEPSRKTRTQLHGNEAP